MDSTYIAYTFQRKLVVSVTYKRVGHNSGVKIVNPSAKLEDSKSDNFLGKT